MRVKIIKPHNIHIEVTDKGRILSSVSFTPSAEPVTVKREWAEELVKVGAAIEVKELAKRAVKDEDGGN